MKKTVKLGEICKVQRGTTITKKNTVKGVVPVIGGGTKPTYFHNEANRESGCITVSGSGASAGYVNYWDTPIFASDCTTVETNNDEILQRFVYYFMQSQQQYIYENFRSGTAQPHVYAKDIATFDFPVKPITEQQSIVNKLNASYAEIDKALGAAQAAEVEINILWSRLLRSTLVEVASHCKEIKLFEIANVRSGSPTPKGEGIFDNGDQHFVRTSDVGRIRVGLLNSSRDKVNLDGSKKLRLFPKGTILIPKSGASTFLNYRVILGMDAFVSSTLAAIQVDSSLTIERFIWYFLQTVDASDLAPDGAYPSLSINVIMQIKVPLPPILEQQKIVRKLDAIFAEIGMAKKSIQQTQDHLSALRLAILKQEIQGELP